MSGTLARLLIVLLPGGDTKKKDYRALGVSVKKNDGDDTPRKDHRALGENLKKRDGHDRVLWPFCCLVCLFKFAASR